MSDATASTTTLPTLRVAPTAVQSVPPEIAQRLTPGAVLDVTIQRGSDDAHGILVDGTFVAAAIPPDLQDGSDVTVQVVRTAPAIVLRVVSLDPAPLPTRPSTLLDQAFRILLSGEDLATLRESFRGLERPIGESLRALTATIVSNQTASNSLQEIARHLIESSETLRVLDDAELKTPEKLHAALERIFGESRAPTNSPKATGIGGTATEKLSAAVLQAREIPLAQKTLDRLRAEITTLLSSGAPLTFSESEFTEATLASRPQDLSATARSIAIAGGRSHSFADLVPHGRGHPAENTPVAIFLRALSALGLELSRGESPLQQELGGLARALAQTLNRIPPGATEDADIRAALTATAQKLDAVASRIRDQSTEATLLVRSAEIQREIERVTDGQEILRALAPVARSLGEPVAMFIPAVVHGLLTKFEFTFYPPPRVEDSADGRSESESEFFERIDLKLPLPALGAVHIAVARRPGEALINLTCETAAAHNHLEGLMPKLEEILARLGYERRTIAASVGDVPSAVPEWCRNVTRSERIA